MEDDQQMRARLLEARRKMMAGVPVTAADREAMEAMEAFARMEEIPVSPLAQRVGAFAAVVWMIATAGLVAREYDRYAGVAEAVSRVAYPIALGGWVAYFFLRERDRRRHRAARAPGAVG